MKEIGKWCAIGVAIGAVELAVIAWIAFGAKAAAFEDLACGFGIATLLFALLVLFGGRRSWAGMGSAGSPMNANANAAFSAQVAFEESRLTKGVTSLPGYARKTIAIFIAAAVVLAGFGISLLV